MHFLQYMKSVIFQLTLKGPKCSLRLKNIPFKPLSERMLEEPFWLGLMAVLFVLLILGIGYYFKEHVPDKFDKFLSYGVDVTSPVNEKPPGKLFFWTEISQ